MHILKRNSYYKKYYRLGSSERGWKIIKKNKAKANINKNLI